MIMWIVVPIEYRREQPILFRRWIRSVRAIASKPYNSVTVSSRFMQEYVGSSIDDVDGRASKVPSLAVRYTYYFTGMMLPVMPALHSAVHERYAPSRAEVLLATHRRGWRARNIFDELIAFSYTQEPFLEFATIKSLYPERFSFAQLREHPAAVFIP